MDPLSIISFAGTVLQIFSWGHDMVELAQEVRRSETGTTRANESTGAIAKKTEELSVRFRIDKPTTVDEKALYEAAQEAETICRELRVYGCQELG